MKDACCAAARCMRGHVCRVEAYLPCHSAESISKHNGRRCSCTSSSQQHNSHYSHPPSTKQQNPFWEPQPACMRAAGICSCSWTTLRCTQTWWVKLRWRAYWYLCAVHLQTLVSRCNCLQLFCLSSHGVFAIFAIALSVCLRGCACMCLCVRAFASLGLQACCLEDMIAVCSPPSFALQPSYAAADSGGGSGNSERGRYQGGDLEGVGCGDGVWRWNVEMEMEMEMDAVLWQEIQ